MNDDFFTKAQALIIPFEGSVNHMYLDTRGLVTVGVGNYLPNVDAAQALDFVNTDTHQNASTVEIAIDYNNVSKQVGAKRADYYKQFCKLELPQDKIDILFNSRVSEFVASLNKSYPDYNTYPESVQLAMLDMAFNLGVGGLKTKWPKLNAAIAAQDWTNAATCCIRPGGQQSRNDATVALFLQGVS